MATLLIHRTGDSVGVATEDICAGDAVTARLRSDPEQIQLAALDDVPLGHKVALVELMPGDEVIEYGVPIGVATSRIRAGAHVHVHNLKGQRWA